ncbi:hypothetical protein LUZ60_017582 [Juncus effusus]|nr:hypothetical protein LUZ60_017582 [Juncus effusus]
MLPSAALNQTLGFCSRAKSLLLLPEPTTASSLYLFGHSKMAFWGVEVKPGKPYSHCFDESRGRLRISQATLGSEVGGDKSAKPSIKTVLQCNVGDKTPIILCSLFTNTSETCHLDFQFEEPDEEVVFSVLGKRSVHLSGYYITPTGCCDGSEYESGEDIADTESEDSEFGEFSDDDLSDFIDYDMDINSSSPRKSGVVIEEIVEDEKATNGEKKKERKRQLAIVKKNDDSALPVQSESEDEDGFPVSKEDGKKRKNDDSAPESNGETKKKKKKLDKKNKKGSKGKENEDKKDGEKLEEENNDVPAEIEMKETDNAPSVETKEGKKKNKKKNKKAEKDSSNKIEKEEKEEREDEPQKTRTFANGLIIEETKMGKPDGKRANPGSKVSVNYVGKLKNGKIFDSNVGQRPFKFRLGIGQVIKGWDVGVNGMRVGDKRRLTIPPAMGYGDQKAGAIPKNSWLVFDVELVDVN